MVRGIMVRGDNSGIGNQSRRLVELIKPERILYIDSTNFAKNKTQHTEWYDNFHGYKVNGFPNDNEVRVFMKGLTHFYCIENPHNFLFFSLAQQLGITTYCASNYEFCDNLANKDYPRPTKFLMPSYWKIAEMEDAFGRKNVRYLPPPIDTNEFKEAREINLNRTGTPRFLHIVGTLAAHDRNGTLSLLEAVKNTTSDFELVIASQHELPSEYMTDDRRVKYILQNSELSEMYKDYDALILPRRYGGLSLTTNEALMSGLPVIMPDISPNNLLLPKEWLVRASKIGDFIARVSIDIYGVHFMNLAKKIDEFANMSQKKREEVKLQAFEIGFSNFSFSALKDKYNELWSQ